MSIERDEPQDELLRRVVDELQRPVRLDPMLDQRVLRTLAEERGGISRPSRRPALAGIAALAAGVMLTLLVRASLTPTAGPVPVAVDRRPVASADATRPVHIRLNAPSSSRVVVVGDFNDWDPAATPLLRTTEQGEWSVELRLKPGRYHYTFLIDGRRWEGDPSEPRAPESDFGAPVSVLTVT
jgi:hypothetical protein